MESKHGKIIYNEYAAGGDLVDAIIDAEKAGRRIPKAILDSCSAYLKARNAMHDGGAFEALLNETYTLRGSAR